jgi:hypothetical protein
MASAPVVFAGSDHRIDPQVAFRGRRATDLDRFTDGPDMQRVCIGDGMHAGHRDAETAAGAGDTAGDFAAIGDENLLEHGGSPADYIRNTPKSVC